MTQSPYLRLPALVEYRERAAARRAAAFCDIPDTVLGIPVEPLTPRSYSRMFASRSTFIFGKADEVPSEDDVINFLWFHSAGFVLPGHPEWEARKRRALAPWRRAINPPWRRAVGLGASTARRASAMAIAVSEITAIIDDAFADAPGATEGGQPIASLAAHFVHEFSNSYPSWTVERIMGTPLAQLFQLYRCAARQRGIDVRDRREDAILHAHLRLRNEAIRANANN